MTEYRLLEGYTFQFSPDGRGHSWETITDDTVFAHVDQLMEIDCEIIDEGLDEGEQVMTNGLLYRWYPTG